MAIEDLFDECGGFGKFQLLVLFGLASHKCAAAWSMMQMSFAGFIPDWWCEPGPPLTNASLYDNATLRTCSVTPPGNASQPVQCASYRFEDSPRTIISEWNLVCDLKWVKSTVTSIQMAGVLVGAILGGQLSDLIGRKKTLFIAALVHCIVNVGAAFSTSWEMFAVFRFFLGALVGISQTMNSLYIMEFMPIKWRPVQSRFPAWPIGTSILALTAYFLEDWSLSHIGCAVLGVPILLGWFFIPDSVRWLTIQGRLKDAEEVIGKISAVNGTDIPPQTKAVLQEVYSKEQESRQNGRKYSYWDLFRGWSQTKINLIFFLTWFTLSSAFYGISFGVGALAGNLYLNIFLLAVVDVPLDMCTLHIVNRFGRKRTAGVLLTGTALFSCACLVVIYVVPSDSQGPWITAFSLSAKMTIGSCWTTIMVWTAELYPTSVRSLGFGWVKGASRAGGIAAPFLIDLDHRKTAAYMTMTGLFLGVVLLTRFLPETTDKNMPDTFNSDDAAKDIDKKDVGIKEVPEVSNDKLQNENEKDDDKNFTRF